MEIENQIIKRNYVFTQKELKEKLGIKGDILNMGLWEGLGRDEREEGKSHEKDTWAIETEEEEIEN